MIIYYSMIGWIIFVYFLLKGFLKGEQVRWVPMFFAILTFGYIIFWVGMRSGVADTAAYISGFRSYGTSWQEIWEFWQDPDAKAPGFATFNILFKRYISVDYHKWLMTIAIITGVPIAITLQKRSCNFFYSAFLFMVMLHYTWMLNGMRQFIVVAIMFLCSGWIVENKWLRYMIVLLLLSTVHYTALIMLPIYWIVKEKPWSSKVIFFILLVLGCAVFTEPFVDALEGALENTAYSGTTQQFAMDDGVNPLRVLVMCVPPAVAFWRRRELELRNNRYINICVNMSVVAAGLYFIGIFTSGIMVGRLPIYFEVHNLILLPYLFDYCFNEKERTIMYMMCTIGYIIFFYLQSGNAYYVSDLTGLLQ